MCSSEEQPGSANGDPNGAPIVTDAGGSWVVLVREDLPLPVVWFE